MVDKLHTEKDMLVTPNDRLTASAACCCPDCTICADDFARADNLSINAGAPFAWTGDTSSFTINGNRLRTAVSGVAVSACSGDRVSVTITRVNTGGSYSANQAVVKLSPSFSVTAVVTFPSSAGEPGRLALTGGASVGGINYVDVPEITNRAQVTLCVRQIRPYNNTEVGLLGVAVTTAEGNATVSGYLHGTAFDPDSGTYGTAGIGTGTIDETHSAVYFDNFKVQHLKGAVGDDLEDCPQCRPRPCFAAADGGFLPMSTTEGKWYTYSGTWIEGAPATSYIAYSTLASDALKFDGNARGGFITGKVSPLSDDSHIRIYMTRLGAGAPLSSADYVELVPPQGSDPGCVRLMRHTDVLAAAPWSPGGSYPVEFYCLYGAGVWYVEVDFASALLIGSLTMQPFEPAIGLGAAPVPFVDGMELYSATIGHAAEEGYSYCTKESIECEIYPYSIFLGYDAAASVNDCRLQAISGSWTWAVAGASEYLPVSTSAGSYLQVRIPHPSLRAGGYAGMSAQIEASAGGGVTPSDLYGLAVKFGWNNGDSYVLARLVDPATLGADSPRGIATEYLVIYELWIEGVKVDETMPYGLWFDGAAPTLSLSICLGGGVIRVTSGSPVIYAPGLYFRYQLPSGTDYGDGPYWGMGLVGSPPSGYRFRAGQLTLHHTAENLDDYLPSTGPFGCAACEQQIAPEICSGENLPQMIKLVVAGVAAGVSCVDGTCASLNSIYFVPFSHIYPFARYTLTLPPTTHASCAWHYNRIYVDLTDTTIQAALVHANEVSGIVWSSTTVPCAGFSNLSLTSDGHGNDQCNFDSATCVATSIP